MLIFTQRYQLLVRLKKTDYFPQQDVIVVSFKNKK